MNYHRKLERAVGKVYADADLQLERAQMNLLMPESAPHTVQDVIDRRRDELIERNREHMRELGQIIGGAFRQQVETVNTFISAFGEVLRGDTAKQLPGGATSSDR